MSAKILGDANRFEWQLPVELFKTGLGTLGGVNGGVSYLNTPDGQRFIMNMPYENLTTNPITVVLNWTAMLDKK